MIQSFGEVSEANLKDSIAKVTQLAGQEKIDKVLVDATEQEAMPSTLEIFTLFSGFPSHIQVAVITHETQPTRQDIYFAETVAQNRGKQIKMFTARTAALDWLKTQ